jgi:chemotaxis protein CheX
MNVVFINPFLEAVVNVLKTMAFTDPKPGKPFLKKRPELLQGDITAVIGLTGSVKGSVAVSFTETAILQAVTNMFGEPVSEINAEVEDAVGELGNMVCGDARRVLESQGYNLQAAIPTVISGTGHKITHAVPGPTIVMPFTIGDSATFFVEVCFENGQS